MKKDDLHIRMYCSLLGKKKMWSLGIEGLGAYVLLCLHARKYGHRGGFKYKNQMELCSILCINSRPKLLHVLSRLSDQEWCTIDYTNRYIKVRKWRKYQTYLEPDLGPPERPPERPVSDPPIILYKDIKTSEAKASSESKLSTSEKKQGEKSNNLIETLPDLKGSIRKKLKSVNSSINPNWAIAWADILWKASDKAGTPKKQIIQIVRDIIKDFIETGRTFDKGPAGKQAFFKAANAKISKPNVHERERSSARDKKERSESNAQLGAFLSDLLKEMEGKK